MSTEEHQPILKKLGLGKGVEKLLEVCKSIENLESPTNQKALSKAAKTKGKKRFGRNTSLTLLTRAK